MKIIYFIIFIFLFNFIKFPLEAKTEVDYNFSFSGQTISIDGLDDLATQFQSRADLNGPFYANSFAFVNILGYPIGKSIIGTFPHIEFGTALGVGLSNMDYFEDGSEASENGSIPGIGPSPILHVGVGIAGGFDLIGKFFVMNKDIYTPDINQEMFTLKEFTMYTFGGRLRYNFIKEAAIIPFLLNFGGLTISCGPDFMRGIILMGGQYQTEFDDIEVATTTESIELDGEFEAYMKWYQLAFSMQGIVFFDILYLFSIYTGFNFSVGYGWFEMGFDAEGIASNDTVGRLGTITLTSENKYNPNKFLPTSIIGLEINLGLLKLNAETMVNMRNRKDVSVLIGTRIQI